MNWDTTALKDAAERIISSFVEAVLAVVVSGGVSGLNASTVHVLVVAGLTAAFATVKTILATGKRGTLSPASLAPAKPRRRAHKQAGYGELEALVRVVIALVVVGFLIWLIVFLVHHVH